jgi:hypothetical protein
VLPVSIKIHRGPPLATIARTVNRVIQVQVHVHSVPKVNTRTVAMLVKIATVVIFPETGLGSA